MSVVVSCPGAPGAGVVSAAAGSASSGGVGFHTQLQPARGAVAGARQAGAGPAQLHTQVQVSEAPGALTPGGGRGGAAGWLVDGDGGRGDPARRARAARGGGLGLGAARCCR